MIASVALLIQGAPTLAASTQHRTACTGITVKTLAPSLVTQTSGLLHGQVNACGATNVKAWFQVLSPPRPATPKVSILADKNQHLISYKLTGLVPQQAVSYRVMAQKGTRLITGNTVRFSTLAPASLKVSAPANVTAGQTFKVSATGQNALGASVGDVTSHTTFTLSPDGSCTGSSCRATVAGRHIVDAKDGMATGTAPSAVAAGPLDHLVLSPSAATVCPQITPVPYANQTCPTQFAQIFSAEGFDAYGNDLGDKTAETTFTVLNGSCNGPACEFGIGGGSTTVTGTDGTAQGTASLTPSDPLTFSCQGEHYDVNNIPNDGCEQAQPHPGYTAQNTALSEGTEPCNDTTSALTQTGTILSDRRVHENPGVVGFDPLVGSTPFWITEGASGGAFCVDDYSLTFTTTGGGSTPCYQATLITNKTTASTRLLTGSDTATITGGSGSYTDGSTIFIEVQKVCNLPVQEAVNWTLSWHL